MHYACTFRARIRLIWATILFAPLLAPSVAIAQCEPRWINGIGSPGADSWVTAMAHWDPDGSGPDPSVLVLGGWFQNAGGVLANCIVTWNPANGEWATLGSGIGYYVGALAVLANNDLVAGGWFDSIGSVPARGIARWDGHSWSALGSGVSRESYDSGVNALAVLPDGSLIAAGKFESAGNVSVHHIARWDGTTWSDLDGGMGGDHPEVEALAVLPDGSLIAGGSFTSAGGEPIEQLARWHDSNWSIVGSNFVESAGSGGVHALTVLPDGTLVAGGKLSTGGVWPRGYAAMLDGTSWSLLGSGTNLEVLTLAARPNGDLVAGGNFGIAGGVAASGVALWSHDNLAWSALGAGLTSVGGVFSLGTLSNGDVIAGGFFRSVGGMPANNIARWGESCECVADRDNDGNAANGGTRDGAVTIDDLLYFLGVFEGSNPDADVDNGTATGTSDGTVDAADLLFFLARFEAGC